MAVVIIRPFSTTLSSTLDGSATLKLTKSAAMIVQKTVLYLDMFLIVRLTMRDVILNIGEWNTAVLWGQSFLLYCLRLGDNNTSCKLQQKLARI